MSIRLQLTLWHVAVLIIILGVTSLGVYHLMTNKLRAVARDKVDAGFATVETILRNSRGDIHDVYHLGEDYPFRIMGGRRGGYDTRRWQELGIDEVLGDNPPAGHLIWHAPDNRVFEVKTGRVGRFGLAFAQDVTAETESAASLSRILLAAFPFALLLGVLGGYFLAGRALSPVSAITHKARQIRANRLDQRLPVANPHDEIGELAAVFNETLAQLEGGFSQLKRFTADASHELRIPLTAIRSVGEVTLQGPEDAKTYRHAISSMLEELDRLTRLVDSLLKLSRQDAGKMQLHVVRTDLTGLVSSVVESLRILAEEKNQSLSLECKPPLPVSVDETTINQALSNVLHNAVQYTPANGSIAVTVAAVSDDSVAIDVIDEGPGIPVRKRQHVFERFYRMDKGRSREQGGAGLGLSLAQWAVQANGGHIEFCDKEGAGTWCRITLPIARD